jgi:hypothetical protein
MARAGNSRGACLGGNRRKANAPLRSRLCNCLQTRDTPNRAATVRSCEKIPERRRNRLRHLAKACACRGGAGGFACLAHQRTFFSQLPRERYTVNTRESPKRFRRPTPQTGLRPPEVVEFRMRSWTGPLTLLNAHGSETHFRTAPILWVRLQESRARNIRFPGLLGIAKTAGHSTRYLNRSCLT